MSPINKIRNQAFQGIACNTIVVLSLYIKISKPMVSKAADKSRRISKAAFRESTNIHYGRYHVVMDRNGKLELVQNSSKPHYLDLIF